MSNTPIQIGSPESCGDHEKHIAKNKRRISTIPRIEEKLDTLLTR